MERRTIGGKTAKEIVASVEQAVRHGALEPGDALPSIRNLASDLAVSPMTVSAAFKELKGRGIITTQERKGARVARRPPIARRSAVRITTHHVDLSSDNPDPQLLPELPIGDVPTSPRLYGHPVVLEELQASAVNQFRNLGVNTSRVGVFSGTFDAVERLLEVKTSLGDRIAVEDPGYTGVLDLVRSLGRQPVPVRLDEAGVDPMSLEKALDGGARALICTPRAQNPTGAAFTEGRASDLKRLLAEHESVLVIEDDHAGPISTSPYETLVGNRRNWAIVRSVSKSLGPDLRVATVAADETTLSLIEGRQALASGWVSSVLQRLVVNLWSREDVAALLRKASLTYDQRRIALLKALQHYGIPARGRSGLNVWVSVPEEGLIIRNLMALGWVVSSGEPFRIDSAPGIRVTTATLEPHAAEQFALACHQSLAPSERTSGR